MKKVVGIIAIIIVTIVFGLVLLAASCALANFFPIDECLSKMMTRRY